MSPHNGGVTAYLCECGPIIRDLIDLDALTTRLASLPDVVAVERHSTLCSDAGRVWLAERLAEHPERRPVIAACSPREHSDDFAACCEAAGLNAFVLGRANLREQNGWVTPDREQATDKAFTSIRGAIARTLEQMPLETHEVACNTDALVIGAGVAGMTAALLLADAGRTVTVVEREPAIGGQIVLFGEAYPDMECASCMLEPLMDRLLHHPQIDVLTSSTVTEVLGYLGNYTARIATKTRHVDAENCYGCRTCAEACPVEVADAVNRGMSVRKAVDIPYAGALPNASIIDTGACLHFSGGECEACVAACPFGNIDLSETDVATERQVGAIVIATGTDLRAAEDGAFSLPTVLTTYEFERILNTDGPTGGEVRLPDADPPATIALVHCADEFGNGPAETCSGTCCMSLAKYATEIEHRLPSARVIEFVWDRAIGGKRHREFARSAAAWDGLTEIRLAEGDTLAIVPGADGGARIHYTVGGAEHEVSVELIVAAPPQTGARGADALGALLGAETDAHGFYRAAHEKLLPFASRTNGVYIAGTAAGARHMEDTSAHAAAAAGAVLSALVPGRMLALEAVTAVVDAERCGGCRICTLACPYSAITFDTEARAASVNELLCHGCGTCAAACPSSAITARHFTDSQISAEIRALSSDEPELIPSGTTF